MFYDIVFPKGNEQEFISTAEKLEIEGLAFAYQSADRKSVEKIKESIAKMQEKTKVRLSVIFDVKENQIYKVHDIGETAIADASGESREIIARYQPDLVYNLEMSQQKDFGKFRNSGLDKATVQFAKSNNVIAAVSFSVILKSEDPSQVIGRAVQNMVLCRKYKVKLAIASFATTPIEMRSPHDLKSFLLAMGAHTESAKKATETVSELFK